MAPQGPLQGTSWASPLPPHPVALSWGAVQLPCPMGPGTVPLPRGPRHSSLCPWVSTGKAPCVQGESWQSNLCPMEPWHSSLCPSRSPGTAPCTLGEHWHSFFCPKRDLTQLPLTSGGGPGTAPSAPVGVLAQLPLPHRALARLSPPWGSPDTALSAPRSPGTALSAAGKHWHSSLSPGTAPTPRENPAAVLRGFSPLAEPSRLLAVGVGL